MNTDQEADTLKQYYAARAQEYEEIYFRDDAQRQKEQLDIQECIKTLFSGKNVLEVACGTGYWTQFAAETARSITATDCNSEVLDIARQKNYACPVIFNLADAYHLPFAAQTFTGGMAGFWLSHVPKDRINNFLASFHKTLQKGACVFIADNMLVPGVGGELVTKNGDENTYKLRTLKDGTQQEILKNYFTREDLFRIFSRYDSSINPQDVFTGECFWYLHYTVAG